MVVDDCTNLKYWKVERKIFTEDVYDWRFSVPGHIGLILHHAGFKRDKPFMYFVFIRSKFVC